MRDDFTEDAKRTLAARAGNTCSNPDCRAPTAGPHGDSEGSVNIGVAAHITGAAPGGPRFNPSLSPEERRHIENGIWLCQNCAKLVDNDVVRFTEVLLRAWRAVAEDQARNRIGKTGPEPPEPDSQRKIRAIRPWVGKSITLTQMNTGKAVMLLGPTRGSSQTTLMDCTEYVVRVGQTGRDGWSRSIPLANVEVSFDDSRNCLELQERYA